MNLRLYFSVILLFSIAACSSKKSVPHASTTPVANSGQTLKSPFECVNPFIGTGGHGHTYPGATLPFGMVQLSPDTRMDGWDGCGGYHYSDSTIYGFSHTHLQGTGVSDYGDILFMPTNNKLKIADKWNDAYKSKFQHSREKVEPGYYSVHLDDYNIEAELTATERTGIHRYKMAPTDSCRLFIDMMHRDEIKWYDIQTIGDSIIYGYRVSKGWAEEQHCYFYAVFSKPFHDFIQLDIGYNEPDKDGIKRQVIEQVQVFSLQFDPTDEIMVKVGISGVDCDGAKSNLYSEAPHWDFEKYRQNAKAKWESQLAKIEFSQLDEKEKTNAYSAFYHCSTTPNLWSDVDQRYRGMDKKIHVAKGYNHYTIFSLWDTFRALHPLFAQVEPERTRDFIQTFLQMYRESGHLPVWELAGNETNCMIGYHAVSVIADAYAKGITDFDHELALEAMVKTATEYGDDKKVYEEMGYLPADRFSESVSKTLEYAYNDWCIAQFAQSIGHQEVYDRFIKRAQNWKNLYDPKTGFMRPRRNGGFIEPFDPYEVNFNFTEANAWQYQFFVPHDMGTLIEYMGGEKIFEQKLDQLFSASQQTSGREQADITGLIGQYAHGNEPSHHLAYLYNYTSHPEKCDERVAEIMKSQYQPTPDGLCGNEDCGQMSAWYVMSAMGKYNVSPGDKSPIEGNRLYDRQEKKIVQATPKKIMENIVFPSPIIQGPQTTFKDSATIEIFTPVNTKHELHITYLRENERTGENETVNLVSTKNSHTFTIHEKATITSWLEDAKGNKMSHESHAVFYLRSNTRTMVSVSAYDHQYNGGGNDALIDGLRGGPDFRTGAWQGFRNNNLEATIDLGKELPISYVSISCLEEIKSWIWYPSEFEIFLSHDGQKFASAGVMKNTDVQDDYTVKTKEFTKQLRGYARYVKVVVKPAFETIPSWHLGAGGTPWIFADEILIGYSEN